MPNATRSVSPSMKCTSFGSMPSFSHRICLNTVSWPWPCVLVPISSKRAAARLEPDLGIFRRRPGRLLDRVRQADAAQLAARARLPRGGRRSRHSRTPPARSPCSGRTGRSRRTARARVLYGIFASANDVAAAQFDRIDAAARRAAASHRALDQIDRLGPPGAAIGRGGAGVRQHRIDRDVGGRNVVHADHACRSGRTASATAGPTRYRRRCSPACAAAGRGSFASASNASSISPTLSRPCSSASSTSERSHFHFTGRPSLRAAHSTSR